MGNWSSSIYWKGYKTSTKYNTSKVKDQQDGKTDECDDLLDLYCPVPLQLPQQFWAVSYGGYSRIKVPTIFGDKQVQE